MEPPGTLVMAGIKTDKAVRTSKVTKGHPGDNLAPKPKAYRVLSGSPIVKGFMMCPINLSDKHATSRRDFVKERTIYEQGGQMLWSGPRLGGEEIGQYFLFLFQAYDTDRALVTRVVDIIPTSAPLEERLRPWWGLSVSPTEKGEHKMDIDERMKYAGRPTLVLRPLDITIKISDLQKEPGTPQNRTFRETMCYTTPFPVELLFKTELDTWADIPDEQGLNEDLQLDVKAPRIFVGGEDPRNPAKTGNRITNGATTRRRRRRPNQVFEIKDEEGDPRDGYIYFITEGTLGRFDETEQKIVEGGAELEPDIPRPVKIGLTTRNVPKRLKELQTGNPRKLICLGRLFHDNIPALEMYLHDTYQIKRMSGEWFLLTPTEVMGLVHFMQNHTFVSEYEDPEPHKQQIEGAEGVKEVKEGKKPKGSKQEEPKQPKNKSKQLKDIPAKTSKLTKKSKKPTKPTKRTRNTSRQDPNPIGTAPVDNGNIQEAMPRLID